MQRVVAQLPWGHNVRLLDTVKVAEERAWYARQTIEHGWSRPVLVHQIESQLFVRQGSALTNFSRTLPTEQSELAQQLLKDPYTFDFLALGPDMLERDLERGLIEHLRSLILELGKGFAFVGSQYHLEVGGQDYYLDLLFYHLRLRCFVVIELKIEDFKPEFAGKMNFYLSAVDDQLRHKDDQPTIGIILCKGRNEVITHGPTPVQVEVSGLEQAGEKVRAFLHQWPGTVDGQPPQSFCVVASSEKNRDALELLLQKAGEKTVTITAQSNHTEEQGAVHMATMHRAKGLEFDYVAVVAPSSYVGEQNEESNRRQLLYVALTRAKRGAILVLICG